MESPRSSQWKILVAVSLLLLVFPLGIVLNKIVSGGYSLDSLVPVQTYNVAVEISYIGHGDSLLVEAFLPVADDRLTIEQEDQQADLPEYREIHSGNRQDNNRLGRWSGSEVRGPGNIRFHFLAYAEAFVYEIDPDISIAVPGEQSSRPYLETTSAIQAQDIEIDELASRLAPDGSSLLAGLRSIHGYCQDLNVVSFKGTTDAVTTLRLGEASCNGKSRLFVAMCRNRGIPARLVGGLILSPGVKRTSHQWVEVLVGAHWVPFCPTNDYFAMIPANYLPLYRGDEVLFRHTRDINFSYRFRIHRNEGIRADLMKHSLHDPLNLMGVWETFQEAGIPFHLLKVLLMIPLGTLVLVILRNVIGLTTFGTFLPILVAVASRTTGLYWGLLVFVLLIFLVFVIRSLVVRLDLLHIPQMSILLSFAVIFVLAVGAIGVRGGYVNLAHVSMFPIAIMAITTERFSLMMEEEGLLTTAKVTLMTVVAIACCFVFMNSVAFQIIFLTFPELVLVVLFLNIWLGRWVGLRVMEYWRFRGLLGQGGGGRD